MDLIYLIVGIAIIGFFTHLVLKVPMPDPFPALIVVLIIFVVGLYALRILSIKIPNFLN